MSHLSLAQRAGNTGSRVLLDAIQQLRDEREALSAERTKLETVLIDKYLDQAAGDGATGIDRDKHRINEINAVLGAMNKAEALLRQAHDLAVLREKRDRIKQLDKTIDQNKKQLQDDYTVGIDLLAQAYARLASCWGGNPFSMPNMSARVLKFAQRIDEGVMRDYVAAVGKISKMPMARDEFERARAERAELLREINAAQQEDN